MSEAETETLFLRTIKFLGVLLVLPDLKVNCALLLLSFSLKSEVD